MFILGIIAGALAVLLSVVGFVIITFGLWKSFAKDAFNRAIYLGLALISTAAIIFALSGPIFVGGLIFDLLNAQDDEPVASAPVEEDAPTVEEEDSEFVEGDNDVTDPGSLGVSGMVEPVDIVEEAAAMTNGNYFHECIESDNASDFSYATLGIDGPGTHYIVPISPFESYVVSPSSEGPAILYVNSDDYVVASANDVAYDYSYLPFPEEQGVGLDPIDTDSEAFKVAEGCVS